jgi:PAS domain S-box-containing protein
MRGQEKSLEVFESALEAVAGGDCIATAAQALLRGAVLGLGADWGWLLLLDETGSPSTAFRYPSLPEATSPSSAAAALPEKGTLRSAARSPDPVFLCGEACSDLGGGEVCLLPIRAAGRRALFAIGTPLPKKLVPSALGILSRRRRKIEEAVFVTIQRERLAGAIRSREIASAVLEAVSGVTGADDVARIAVSALIEATGWPSVRLWRLDDDLNLVAGSHPENEEAREPGDVVRAAVRTGRSQQGECLVGGNGSWTGVELAVPLEASGWGSGALWCATTGAAPFRKPDLAIVKEVARVLRAPLERGAAHEEVLTRLHQFEALNDQSPDLLLVTDRDGEIKYVNRAYETHTGWSRDEILGRSPSILRSGVHPPDTYSALWSALLAGRVYRGVLVNRKRSGENYYEEKTITPIRDARGRITHFFSNGRDVTERIEAQARQRDLQQHIERAAAEWTTTFDAVPFPILVLSPEDEVVRANRPAQELWGASWDEIVGHPLPTYLSGPWPEIRRAVRQCRGRSGAFPSLLERKPPRPLHWDVTASILRGDLMKDHIIVLARDITALVELQESLRDSETMAAMGSIMAGVAHEVRNPLFAILATLEAFENEFSSVEGFSEFSSTLKHEANRLTSLMQDLLEYGRPLSTSLDSGPLEEPIRNALRSCDVVARKARVTVAENLQAGLPQIRMDRRRLSEVFHNLIENAIQHSSPGSKVSVAATLLQLDGPLIRVTVEDSGPGLAPEDAGRLFTPFFSRRRGGTGLGLAIVQRIAEEHSAEVRLENRPEGGAIATVDFPLHWTDCPV